MLKLKAIDHINMNVANLDETIDFYQRLFGFEVKERGVSDNSGMDYVIIGSSDHGFLAIYDTSSYDPLLEGNISHFGFQIENFDEALASLKELGVKLGYGNGITEYENSRSIYILDPNGIEIELTEKFGGGL